MYYDLKRQHNIMNTLNAMISYLWFDIWLRAGAQNRGKTSDLTQVRTPMEVAIFTFNDLVLYVTTVADNVFVERSTW